MTLAKEDARGSHKAPAPLEARVQLVAGSFSEYLRLAFSGRAFGMEDLQ